MLIQGGTEESKGHERVLLSDRQLPSRREGGGVNEMNEKWHGAKQYGSGPATVFEDPRR